MQCKVCGFTELTVSKSYMWFDMKRMLQLLIPVYQLINTGLLTVIDRLKFIDRCVQISTAMLLCKTRCGKIGDNMRDKKQSIITCAKIRWKELHAIQVWDMTKSIVVCGIGQRSVQDYSTYKQLPHWHFWFWLMYGTQNERVPASRHRYPGTYGTNECRQEAWEMIPFSFWYAL